MTHVAQRIALAETFPAQHAPERIIDRVVMDYDERRKRRHVVTGVNGTEVVIDLAEAPALREGDALITDAGLVMVVPAAEPLLEVRGRDAVHLARLAWHVGNRHLEAEISPKWLRIRADHVIAEMLKGLGAKVMEIEAPFDPEGGAYAQGHDHAHDHGHFHDPARPISGDDYIRAEGHAGDCCGGDHHHHDHHHHHAHEHGAGCCGGGHHEHHNHSHDHHHEHGHGGGCCGHKHD